MATVVYLLYSRSMATCYMATVLVHTLNVTRSNGLYQQLAADKAVALASLKFEKQYQLATCRRVQYRECEQMDS